jgi:hypothetical protein
MNAKKVLYFFANSRSYLYTKFDFPRTIRGNSKHFAKLTHIFTFFLPNLGSTDNPL